MLILRNIPILTLTLLQILQWVPSVQPERILVISFFASKSHKITYMRLIEELANKGHEITVLTPLKPLKTVKNIKEIFTLDAEAEVGSNFDMIKAKENNERFSPLKLMANLKVVCEKTYNLPQVKEVLTQSFDLIFMQPAANECALGIVHKLKAPLVLFMPISVPDFFTSRMGNRMPPSFVPHIIMNFSPDMSFWERFLNFGLTVLFDLGSQFLVEPGLESIYRKHLGEDTPSIRAILGNASLLLSNGHFSVSGPRPYLSDTIDVGGIHSRPAKKLPEDLEKFVSKPGTEGVIYFSMGSIINTNSCSEAKQKMFIQAFSKFPKYQIIWKWNNEKMEKPENIYLSNWLPQQDILGHPKTKIFISHCGGGSTEESIYHGVPLLGLPMFGDQPNNAQLGKRLGILKELDWNELTAERLEDAINQVLHNSTYTENVKKLSNIFRDQIQDPLKVGVYWIEYVMRHKGAPHLRSAARNLNYFQYHSWDIVGTYLILIVLVIFILIKSVKMCLRKTCSIFNRNSKPDLKKKHN